MSSSSDALPTTTEALVVGLGGFGSATAYWLARRGVQVLGLEQFELGHVRGASHDHSRIIRRSYHTPGYVALTAEAYDTWRTVEADSGESFVAVTGGLDLFPAGAAIGIDSYRHSLDTVGVPYEVLDGTEVRRRFPPLAAGHLVDADLQAIHQADGGIVAAGRATAALQRLAVAHGADLREHICVRALRPVGGEVDVVTDAGVVRAGQVVVAADAWTARLLAPLGIELPLAITREQVSYFPRADLAPFRPERFPVWVWMDDPSFYGFPVFGDPTAIKAAEDCGGPDVHPDTRTFDPDPAMEHKLAEFMHGLLGPGIGAPRTVTCLYTMTSDRDFLCDRLPEHPQISAALGSGHGFKFAAWFGRTLAGLACGEAAGPELAPFSFSRPSLVAPVSREAWMQ